MAIPDFQSLMIPLLQIAADGKEHLVHDAVRKFETDFALTDEEKETRIASGSQTVLMNRTHWARTYLKKALLLTDPRRSYFQITQRGLDLLAENPKIVNKQLLKRYPEFVEFASGRPKEEKPVVTIKDEETTPEEQMEIAYQSIRTSLIDQLIEEVTKTSPAFFERLVVDLLFAMGYGGTRRELALAVGKSGDEGIDGVIQQDRLGLDTIYLQAKKWQAESTVGRPDIQRFVGALHGKHARRGVFLTTAKFSKEALDYVTYIDTKVILIDGQRLANLMIDYGVGVSLSTRYEIKTIDHDFFTDDI